MGQSTDAILCFGVDLGECVDDDYEPIQLPWRNEDEDSDFEEWFYQINGLSTASLWEGYDEWADQYPDLWNWSYDDRMARFEAEVRPGFREDLDSLYEKRKGLLDSCPIEIVQHCSGDYPMYIVAVKGTVTIASRGYPQTISVDSLMEWDSEMEIRAEAFCTEHGIPFEDPQWLLASMWS